MGNKTAFLCNPSLRWRKKFPGILRRIHRLFGPDASIFIVDRDQPDSCEKHLKTILAGEFDRIAVGGGDGSLNRTVSFLKRERALDRFELGVIPLGTCNDFARNLGLAGKVRKSLKVLAEGRTRTLSIAEVNGRIFINNAGFGKKNPTAKRKSPVAVIREMNPVKLVASWDGGVFEDQFFMMLCANAPYFSGGLRFSRRSDFSDGLLEFYWVRKMPKIQLLLRLLFGRARMPMHLPLFSKNVLRVQVPSLTFKAREPVSIVVDGEPAAELMSVKEATFKISGSCKFIVPKGRA